MAEALRSDRWFAGHDEVALEHRAALRSLGIEVVPGRPIVGISNTVSDLNPCNSSLTDRIEAARAGVIEAGGTPVVFPTMSLGEDLMKPTAMLYRNLLSIEVEETVRAYPIDALIVTASCDKTVPGALMGAISADVPTVMVIGGSRRTGMFQGRRLAAGTDLWRVSEEHRAGRLSDAEWQEFERCYACGLGSCNVMGTALTMAIVAEVLGFTVPGASSIPADDPRGVDAAAEAGRTAVARALAPIRPRALVTERSLRNALTAVAGAGGSTNAFPHLAAIAGRAGLRLTSAIVTDALRDVAVVTDLQPIGDGFAEDFDAAGGVPALVHALRDRLDLGTPTIAGGTLGDSAVSASDARIIRSAEEPLGSGRGFDLVVGTLAPGGAVIKTAAASEDLLRHRGHAVVFDGWEDMVSRIDDPDLPVTPDSVLVLRGGGPVGGPGMPEWGMVPIPAKLARQGVTDMVRVTDARMSGTAYGTVVLHVSPESAVGGPLAQVRDGDPIVLDVMAGVLDLDVPEAELTARSAAWTAPRFADIRGWVALYRDHVTDAPSGADFDFLQALRPGTETFVEPVIGRS